MKKAILFLLGGALLCAAVFLYMNFNNMALRTSEKIASSALGVQVKIGTMDIALTDKKVTVGDIMIANPQGYKGSYIMEVGQIDIGLKTASSDFIDFNNIDVSDSVVNVEINESGANIVDFKRMLDAPENEGKPSTSAEEAIKVIVEKAAINSSTIKVDVSFLNKEVPSLTMPAVRFNNLGKGGGGIEAEAAMTQIFSRYLGEVRREVAKHDAIEGLGIPGISDAKSVIDAAVDDVTNTIKGLFD